MTTSLPLIFFGTESFSVPTLKALISAGYDVIAVVTKPDARRGRHHQLVAPLVKKIASQHSIAMLQPVNKAQLFDQIEAIAHTAEEPLRAVLVAYGKIIPASVLDLFPSGIINVHPSLLPKYRGPSPIEAAIVSGDTTTGISLMKLDVAMDSGPIFAQKKIPLAGNETKAELYESLGTQSAEYLIEKLPSILDGSLRPHAQDGSKATYCSLLKKSDGELIPESMTAQECERRVRAYIGFPKTHLRLDEHDIIVTKAHVKDSQEVINELVVICKNGTQLVIDKLITPNGRLTSGQAFLLGYKH